MPKTQRYILGTAAMIAWAILWVVSLVANFKFGYSLGSEEVEKYLIGGGSVASDFFKAASPVAFIWFVAHRKRWPAATAFTLALISIFYSVIACTGFVASERMAAYDAAKLESMKTVDRKQELDKARELRNWSAKARPVAVVQADLERYQADVNYRITNGCTKVGRSTNEWCREYLALGPELAQAKENLKAEAKVEDRRADFYTATRLTGDYQVKFWSWLSGIEDQHVLLAMMIMAVLLIEFGSAFGLGIAMALLAPESAIGRAFRSVVTSRKGSDGAGPGGGGGGGLRAPWPMGDLPVREKIKVVPTTKPAVVEPDTKVARAMKRPVVQRTFRLPAEPADRAQYA